MISSLLALSIGAPGQLLNCEFVFTTTRSDVQKVNLGGTFNNWNPTDITLQPDTDRKTWRTSLNLAPGKYQYKFILNGSEWVMDPNKPTQPDGMGHTNNLLALIPKGYELQPGEKGDSKITPSGVFHDRNGVGRDYDKGQLSLRFTTRAQDVARVELEYATTGSVRRMPLKAVTTDEVFSHFRAVMPWKGKGNFTYSFVLVDGYNAQRFGPQGLTPLSDKGNTWTLNAKTFQPFVVPNWVEDAIFYQIFPDRFANGNPKNDPKGVVPWNAKPTFWNWKGGDAAGIRAKRDYLTRLGINGIYINPIMDAPAYHRYDPVDFYKVCPFFGTNDEFVSLTRELDAAGIRVVLDQIFDHVGITFPPFVDLLKNQQNSKYKDWFFVKSWPVEVRQNPPYVGWYGVESMPKVNLAHPEVKKYLLDSVDFWMKKAKLSGWRLDVANEVPQWFWREFRTRVKGIDPQAWIVGEVWSDARTWLQGDQWDASMNYPFRYANLAFIANDSISANAFTQQLMEAYNWYAPQVARNQLNLLSSHDTSRFITDAGNNVNLAKLAAIVQMTWVGAPSIYYGEEIGMLGGADPANRMGMEWERATDKNDMLQHYRKLIAIRKGSPILRRGTPVALQGSDSQKVAAYGRTYEGQSAVVAINRSDKPQTVTIPLNDLGRQTRLTDALTGKPLRLSDANELIATLAPYSAVIGLPASASSSSAGRTRTSSPHSKVKKS